MPVVSVPTREFLTTARWLGLFTNEGGAPFGGQSCQSMLLIQILVQMAAAAWTMYFITELFRGQRRRDHHETLTMHLYSSLGLYYEVKKHQNLQWFDPRKPMHQAGCNSLINTEDHFHRLGK